MNAKPTEATLRDRLAGVALLAACGMFIGGGPYLYGIHVAIGGLVAIGSTRAAQRADREEGIDDDHD
ncbi:MAG: hypothetical protein JST65_12250 [Acidobacteria bacterium]|nr:hypothetical protein [Acidobacteriota bacterium]